MNLKPISGWVLIEELPEEEKTSIGVYLPETAKDKPVKGKVIKKGLTPLKDMMVLEEMALRSKVEVELASRHLQQFQEGDIVVFKKWATNEVTDNGKKYVLVEFKDIIGYYDGGK